MQCCDSHYHILTIGQLSCVNRTVDKQAVSFECYRSVSALAVFSYKSLTGLSIDHTTACVHEDIKLPIRNMTTKS